MLNTKRKVAGRRSYPRYYSAFTLIELLVVLAIIGILACLLMPALNSALSSARIMKCQSSMRQIGISLMNYRSDFNDWLPGWMTVISSGWEGVLVNRNYVSSDRELFRCPEEADSLYFSYGANRYLWASDYTPATKSSHLDGNVRRVKTTVSSTIQLCERRHKWGEINTAGAYHHPTISVMHGQSAPDIMYMPCNMLFLDNHVANKVWTGSYSAATASDIQQFREYWRAYLLPSVPF